MTTEHTFYSRVRSLAADYGTPDGGGQVLSDADIDAIVEWNTYTDADDNTKVNTLLVAMEYVRAIRQRNVDAAPERAEQATQRLNQLERMYATQANDFVVDVVSGAPQEPGTSLAAVATDDTLTGDGLGGSPLSVANPFTDADETKLDGIEANATADQSPAEIKQAYESNANTNPFTDAERTKLASVEQGARGDLTPGEVKGLYEQNPNTNAFTDAERSKLSGVEANATADQSAAEIKRDYESNANTNAFTDTEKTKLAGVEANAQANVGVEYTQPEKTKLGTVEQNAQANVGVEYTQGEKTKLASVEQGATADQSPAEIKRDYESNSNTNAFTDSEKSKLGTVESGATQDQTPAEIRDSLQGLTGTNRLDAAAIKNLPEAEGGLSTVTTDDTITGTGATDSPLSVANPFTDADESKLDGVEANATADQTAGEMRDALQTLTGTNRLDAAAIKNLPEGGGGGISEVESDDTLTGTGSTDSPLSVANPFTDADETKLDGIEASATADQTPTEIKDALETLEGALRLDASAIQNLPSGTGDPFVPTQANLYNAVKAILVHATNAGVTADDTNTEIDVAQFSPTQQNIYNAVKAILIHNSSVTADDTDSQLDIAAGSMGGLDQAAVDARIEEIVLAFARTSSTSIEPTIPVQRLDRNFNQDSNIQVSIGWLSTRPTSPAASPTAFSPGDFSDYYFDSNYLEPLGDGINAFDNDNVPNPAWIGVWISGETGVEFPVNPVEEVRADGEVMPVGALNSSAPLTLLGIPGRVYYTYDRNDATAGRIDTTEYRNNYPVLNVDIAIHLRPLFQSLVKKNVPAAISEGLTLPTEVEDHTLFHLTQVQMENIPAETTKTIGIGADTYVWTGPTPARGVVGWGRKGTASFGTATSTFDGVEGIFQYAERANTIETKVTYVVGTQAAMENIHYIRVNGVLRSVRSVIGTSTLGGQSVKTRFNADTNLPERADLGYGEQTQVQLLDANHNAITSTVSAAHVLTRHEGFYYGIDGEWHYLGKFTDLPGNFRELFVDFSPNQDGYSFRRLDGTTKQLLTASAGSATRTQLVDGASLTQNSPTRLTLSSAIGDGELIELALGPSGQDRIVYVTFTSDVLRDLTATSSSPTTINNALSFKTLSPSAGTNLSTQAQGAVFVWYQDDTHIWVKENRNVASLTADVFTSDLAGSGGAAGGGTPLQDLSYDNGLIFKSTSSSTAPASPTNAVYNAATRSLTANADWQTATITPASGQHIWARSWTATRQSDSTYTVAYGDAVEIYDGPDETVAINYYSRSGTPVSTPAQGGYATLTVNGVETSPLSLRGYSNVSTTVLASGALPYAAGATPTANHIVTGNNFNLDDYPLLLLDVVLEDTEGNLKRAARLFVPTSELRTYHGTSTLAAGQARSIQIAQVGNDITATIIDGADSNQATPTDVYVFFNLNLSRASSTHSDRTGNGWQVFQKISGATFRRYFLTISGVEL